jgi:plastocyanin
MWETLNKAPPDVVVSAQPTTPPVSAHDGVDERGLWGVDARTSSSTSSRAAAAGGYCPETSRLEERLPLLIIVPSGTTVVWTNQGEKPHSVTAHDGSFASGLLNPGESYQVTFYEPGTYTYQCSDSMQGSVTVTRRN